MQYPAHDPRGTVHAKRGPVVSAASLVAVVLVALGMGACKSSSSDPDASSQQVQCADGAASLPGHRPQAVACAVTPVAGAEAGATMATCTSNTDCAGSVYPWCLGGQCHVDQCLSDSDCATGTACECGTDYTDTKDGAHTNKCVPAQCFTDGDCTAGELCAPSRTGYCGATGYYCHTSADTCTTDADCCTTPSLPNCLYQPTLGHWACQGLVLCSG